MKAFIVGITGFVGSHLAEHLLRRQVQVLGCSQHAKWKPGAPLSLASEIPLFSWDLREPLPSGAREQLRLYQPDWIFHLGALSTPQDCGNAEWTPNAWAANVEGTTAVCRMARELPNRPRVLFTSSCHVYAPVSENDPYVTEEARQAPTSAYGKTKLQAERRFLEEVGQGLNGVIARAFHHTGPRQSPRMVLPDWSRQFACDDGSPILVHTLDAYLDLSDVRDVVSAYRLLAERGQSGMVYNVGSGVCRRSGDIFHKLRKLADPDREFRELAPGRRQQPIAETSRLKQATGWKPRIPLEITLQDTLEYWRQMEPATSDRPGNNFRNPSEER